jgi:hypothetical protein
MDIQKRIMLRIYLIWLFRRVTPAIMFQVLFLILAIHLFASSVFVFRVLQTATDVFEGGLWNFIVFGAALLWNSKFAVKIEILTMLIVGYYMLLYFKKAIVAYERIKRP